MKDVNMLLLDADYICHLVSVGKDDEELEDVLERLDDTFYGILWECHQAFNEEEMEFISFLSGGKNLRKIKYPDYKANRTTPKPIHLNACRLQALAFWNGYETDGIEADDAIGISSNNLNPETTIVATADKDFAQMKDIWVYDIYPGRLFHPRKEGQPFIEETLTDDGLWYRTSEKSALKQYCYQLIYGDSGDNIKGLTQFVGKKRGHKKAAVELAFEALDKGGWSWDNVRKTVRGIYKGEFGEKEGNELFEKVNYLVYLERDFVKGFEKVPDGEVFKIKEI